MRRSIRALLIAPVIAACGADTAATPLSAAQLCAKRDSLVAHMTGTTIDDQFELLAQLLPGGFGGLTASFLYLKRPDQVDAFRSTAQVLSACPGQFLPYLIEAEYAPVRQGEYDWVEMRRWYRLLRATVPSTWNTADMNEGTNRLAFTFRTDSALATFRARAIAAGVPDGVLSLALREGTFVNQHTAH